MTTPPASPPAGSAAAEDTATGRNLGTLRWLVTSRLEPFRRINVPRAHRLEAAGIAAIDGQGYDCGCRSTKDYDQKIGKEIGEQISDVLAKIIPVYGAFKAMQAGLSALVKNIPAIGPTIAGLIDDADPVKALLKFVAGEVDGMLVESLFRSVPAWVPVLRNTAGKALHEQELEGFVVRSHQQANGVPYTQWHRWYDWSIVVSPVGDSSELLGRGNLKRTRGDDDEMRELTLDDRRYERHWLPGGATVDQSMSCEWDLGAIGETPGPFLNPGSLRRDWGWPMAGQFVWAGGRSMYDCTHATGDEKSGDEEVGLHLNQLRPLKAIATARWEGFQFPENDRAVPAIQFTFFASNAKTSGGDFKFPAINDADYEFVVELPPGGVGVPSDDPFKIGALPRFRINTLDIGRRLLAHFNLTPFNEGVHHPAQVALEPIVTPVFTSRTRAPTHAHIRIPLTTLSAQIENYGVMVTLGWHDPARTLARRVRAVTVALKAMSVVDRKEGGQAEWIVNLGINGRWFQRTVLVNPGVTTIDLSATRVTLFLADDDFVSVACHGYEEDGEGDHFKLPDLENDPEKPPPDAPKSEFDKWIKEHLASRVLRLSEAVDLPTGVKEDGTVEKTHADLPFVGRPVDWKGDVDQPDPIPASEVARALFLRTAMYLFDSNDPLGLVDPNVFQPAQQFGRANDGADTPNPLKVADLLAEVGLGGTKQCRHTGYAMTRIGRMGTLGYDEDPVEFAGDDDPAERHTVKPDYVLRYEITVRAQSD